MRLRSLRIRNFRSFKEETINFANYTSFVGANGSGKSNVLNALDIFFRETETPGINVNNLTEEDFHKRDTNERIEITVTFDDLSKEAKDDFAHYYRQDCLIISAIAIFDKASQIAEVKQFGYRFAKMEFAEYFEALSAGKLVKELKEIYNVIKKNCPDLRDPGTKDAMTAELRTYEETHPDECIEIPSQDEFYGISRGKNLLEKYIQWVHVPAVKDASKEYIEARDSAFGKLLERTVRTKLKFDDDIKAIRDLARDKYKELLENNQDALKELSDALKTRLIEWAHPEASLQITWRQDPEKSIRVDDPLAQVIAMEPGFEGEIVRFGHGFQRSFLLALLQELSGVNNEGSSTLILACEEPELYQHPPQARHLFNVFSDLTDINSQVIICTHSPYFVSGENFENVRLVKKQEGDSRVLSATVDEVAERIGESKETIPLKRTGELAKLHQALQPSLNEMFFSPRVIFVEGYEDIAYITTYLHLMGLWSEFRKVGCHLIPTDGKSEMIRPLAISKCLGLPSFIIFDADKDTSEKDGKKEKHRKNNLILLRLSNVDKPEPFPDNILWEVSCVMWPYNIEETVKADIGESDWDSFRNQADTFYERAGNLRKNSLHIGKSLKLAWEADKKSKNLQELCATIIKFGASN